MPDNGQRTATLWTHEGWIYVRSTYDPAFVERLKYEFPRGTRQWDGDKKCWKVDPNYLDQLHALCTEFYDKVTVCTPEREPGGDDMSPYEELLGDLPADLLKRVYKLVISGVHPDAGGSTDLCARVNVAWEKICAAKGIG